MYGAWRIVTLTVIGLVSGLLAERFCSRAGKRR
jgi:hypothetical protein